ncbi:MAG TPA: PilZ domain-containing protein [Chloroflexota bacterium]|nr:PilZ domain-containing protein [Chloroflexota bacterium]
MTRSIHVPLERGQPALLGQGSDCAAGLPVWITAREGDRVWVRPRPDAVADLAAIAAPGAVVLLRTWRPGDALYTLRARVLAAAPGPCGAPWPHRPTGDDGDPGDPRDLALQIVDAVRVQRREYFRVPVSIDTDDAWTVSAREGVRLLTLHVDNLSANGLHASRIRAPLTPTLPPVAAGDCLLLRLPLPGLPEPLVLAARVVRVAREPAGGARRTRTTPTAAGRCWECAAVFTDLAPATRERLVQFTLQVQQERLQRGMV